MHTLLALCALLLTLPGCQREEASPPGAAPTSEPEDTGFTERPVEISVTLDGEPLPEALVLLPDREELITTDLEGRATVTLTYGETLVGFHPEARTKAAFVGGSEAWIALERFDQTDNEAYVFQDPGSPTDRDDTSKCAHCHGTINDSWYDSPHRTSASNPVVQGIYAGTGSFPSAERCEAAGGRWWLGVEPGTGQPAERCYLGHGTLPDLHEDCGEQAPCDGVAAPFGGCADCHAPGIDGALGGRDLLEAVGLAYENGVHCDVCHKVEGVDVSDPRPGVAGRLHILRPSEPASQVGFDFAPLSFGPYGDVPNPRMGAVGREHFHEASLCAGCHELVQAALVPGTAVDSARWPEGTLPIHSTYTEWLQGPYAPASPCASCHMPPDPQVGNSADLGNIITLPPGLAPGWYRPPGAVRQHSWDGPRTRDSDMLELAVALDVSTSRVGDELVAEVTLSNVGAGHYLPTGEPLRHLLLTVNARCQETTLPGVGAVLPGWAGALEVQDPTQDLTRWRGAQVGDRVVVVQGTGGFEDYQGFGPFGDGRFSVEEKGLPEERQADVAVVLAVDQGRVTLDHEPVAGARAYLLPPEEAPRDEASAQPRAGELGHAFARVLMSAQGEAMVPHHLAVDVASDNRLAPQGAWSGRWSWTATCAQPELRVQVVHRALPWELAVARGWALNERLITEGTWSF